MRKISVCIITKNESEKLKKCLKHLTGYGFEIVVVDAYAAAVPFYEKNGFIPLNNEDVDSATRLLYFDLNDIVL